MVEPSPEMPLTSVPIADPGIWPSDWKLAVCEAAAAGLARARPGLVAVSPIASTPVVASMPIARTVCLFGWVIIPPIALAGGQQQRVFLADGVVAVGDVLPLSLVAAASLSHDGVSSTG